jgi:hypothetical protein
MNSSDSSGTSQATEMFAEAAKLVQAAMDAGIKAQENLTQSMTQLIDGMGSAQAWQERVQTASDQMLSAAQKNMDSTISLINENTKSSLELLEKAFNSRQAETPEQLQEKARETWETAVGSLRRNAEVMVQANNRMLESWTQLAKVFGGDSPSPKG